VTDVQNSFTDRLGRKFRTKLSFVEVPITPKTCRYTTLRNVNFQKLRRPKHRNSKQSVQKLKKGHDGTKPVRPATYLSFNTPSTTSWCCADHFLSHILVWSVLKRRLTETNRYSRLSRSKQLLIQPDWCYFHLVCWLNAVHSVTLTTLKHYWRITFGTAKNKLLEQNRFFHTRATSSQSLMVTDGALKSDYASLNHYRT